MIVLCMSNDIMQTLKSHGEQLGAISSTVNEHTETLKSHGEQLDIIASAVLEHSGKLDKLDDIQEKIDKLPTTEKLDTMLRGIDALLKKVAGTEQEKLMQVRAQRRMEEKIDQNTKDIQSLKPLLGLA